MLTRTHGQWPLRKFRSEYSAGRLNLSPAFQRNTVWTNTDRQRLIVSVFDGIPLPTVYLYRRVNLSTGGVGYDVIDGKQRIETLLLFAQGGPLAADEDIEWLRFRSDLDGREPIEWRYWPDLQADYRREFLNTVIPVILVEGALSEIAELFVALHR